MAVTAAIRRHIRRPPAVPIRVWHSPAMTTAWSSQFQHPVHTERSIRANRAQINSYYGHPGRIPSRNPVGTTTHRPPASQTGHRCRHYGQQAAVTPVMDRRRRRVEAMDHRHRRATTAQWLLDRHLAIPVAVAAPDSTAMTHNSSSRIQAAMGRTGGLCQDTGQHHSNGMPRSRSSQMASRSRGQPQPPSAAAGPESLRHLHRHNSRPGQWP